MIGGILPNCDLGIFLTDENVKALDSQIVKGTLVRLNERTQIPLELKKDLEKSKYGIDVEEGNPYRVYIFPRFYSDLVANGYIGTRNPLGAGMKISTENYANRDTLLKSELEFLKRFGKI